MRHILLLACAGLVLLAPAGKVFAGLGDPLSSRSPEESLQKLKSSPAYSQALKALEDRGFSKEQADSALVKLPADQLALLGTGAGEAKAGGDLVGLLLFVLFVVLVVYLIMLLVESASYYRY